MLSVRSVLGLAVVLTTGCANVIGLNELEQVDCVGAACSDASVDTTKSETTSETTPIDTASEETSVDSEIDSGSADVDIDSGTADSSAMETSIDASDVGDTMVVMPDTKMDTMVVGDTCTVACDTVRSNGTTCLGAVCAYSSCKAGFANCDTTAPDIDGCETATTNTLNCGGCGVKCEPTNASTAACTSGLCAYTCTSGFGDCDKTGGNTNGCETPLNTLANCGACGAKCDTVRSTGAACTTTGCTYTGCAAGYQNCDTAGTDANGCETLVATSTTSCGACGRACSTTNVMTAACTSGACTSSCNAGFSNCSKPASGPDDGCECATPGCCAGGCAITHKNGTSSPLGQSYWLSADYCKAAGTPGDATTYSADMANAAADAWPVTATPIDLGCSAGRIICKGNSTAGYASWGYTGTLAGHVYWQAGGCAGPTKCCCPFATDPTWN
jgi:hypothetical protein